MNRSLASLARDPGAGRGRAGQVPARQSAMIGRVLAFALAFACALASCVDHTPPPGEVMVEVSTDMSLPKDIDTVRVQILSNGRSYNDQSYAVGPDGLHVPATIGILAGSDPTTTALVRVTAIRKGQAVILREATSEVPGDRIALMRLPLEYLCEDSAVDTPQAGLPADPTVDAIAEAKCSDGETCVEGLCAGSTVDLGELTTYSAAAVYGGGNGESGGACFDTVSCFAQAETAAVQSLQGCTAALPAGVNPEDVNLAIETSDGQGICAGASGQGPCFVPIDEDPKEGWQLHGSTIDLPAGLCAALRAGTTESVVLSTSCPSKTPSIPTCGPWSSVMTPEPEADASSSTPQPMDASTDAFMESGATGGGDGATLAGADAGFDAAIATCAEAGVTTSLTGKVYDPAGKNPLPHVAVFVPVDEATLPAISQGTRSCGTCNSSMGASVAATTTDALGSFTLTGVPTGTIPLVFQIGKWRRVVSVTTAACETTAVSSTLSALPKNKAEGDMPQMALLTGGEDDLGCFLTGVGIDPAEFSAPGGGGRVAVYQGLAVAGNGPGLSNGTAGDCTTSACPLWASRAALESYDLVLLGCEGAENLQTKPAAAIQAMHDWLDEGGRVLATHFQYTWFKDGPADFQGVATWLGSSSATANGTFDVDTTFPEGLQFSQWLSNTGALSGMNAIQLSSVATSVGTVHAPTSRWIYDGSSDDVKDLSFETPVGGIPVDGAGAQYCGKATFTDLHAGGTMPSGDVPGACSSASLSAQEKALEFLFFNLSGCVSGN